MSTVKVTPGICQRGAQSAACSATCYLNAIGKWGSTVAAVFTCRPVQSNSAGLSIAPKGSQGFLSNVAGGNFGSLLILAGIVIVIYLVLEHL